MKLAARTPVENHSGPTLVSLLIESGPVVNAVTCGDQIEWDSIMSPVSLNLVRQCGFPGAVTLNLAGERGIVLTVV